MTKLQTAPEIDAPRPSTPTPPAPVSGPSSWFTRSHEPVTLPIRSQAITITQGLSARTQMSLLTGLTDADSTDPVEQRWEEFQMRKAAAYLQNWTLPVSLVPEPGKDGVMPDAIVYRTEVLRRLKRSQFEALYAAIAAHEQAEVELPIIPPVVSVDADAWFTRDDDTVTLQLPEGHWMRVHTELSQGDTIRLMAPLPKDSAIPPGWPAIRKLDAYLTAWSMVYPNGQGVPLGMDSLAELDASKFAVVNKTIEAYEAALTKARSENPTGADGLINPSALPSA